jgi:hypothetical protein
VRNLGAFFSGAQWATTKFNRTKTNGTRHFDMDEAFCARMRMAIAAGLENAPIGVITTPGTKNPRYLATEPSPLASPCGMDF